MIQRLLFAAVLGLACSRTWAAEAPARPNVLFIVIDNVDYEYFGKCYGGRGLTPEMDRIAERGVTFTRAYAVTPLCVPSRYTCLTGRYASRYHGATPAEANDVDPDEEAGGRLTLESHLPNLPRTMQAAGYKTGFVGKYHLENETLLPKFGGEGTSVFEPEADAWLKKRNALLTSRIQGHGFDYVFNALDFRSSQFRGIEFGNAQHNMEVETLGALSFIDENRDRPFFLYFSTHLLHLPIDPKLLTQDYEKYGRVTEGGLLDEAPRVPMKSRRQIYDDAAAAAGGRLTAQQAGMHWLDCGIGAVIDRLKQRNLLDNTLVILFSDNNQRGKETLYEGGARVPLLMMWPQRFAAGSRCDRIVANVDFAPTIFAACGISPPTDMVLDGRSILPILADSQAAWRDGLLLENGHTKAVVTDRWKYVALRYPPDVQAHIDEVDRTGRYPKLTRKSEIFFEKFKSTLTPEQWSFARNSWRWHTQGNNYMKSIDDFPFQFDADQLFVIEPGFKPQDVRNVAADPSNAEVLADMKAKLTKVLAPLDTSFGEFKPAASNDGSVKGPATTRKKRNKPN